MEWVVDWEEVLGPGATAQEGTADDASTWDETGHLMTVKIWSV